MPTNLDDYDAGGTDLLFADDLYDTQFSVREPAVYEAEEVRADVGGDVPKFGNWIPVVTEDGDGWMVALGELVEEMQSYQNVASLELHITTCEKSGTKQTDSYSVETEIISGDDKQTGL